MEEGPLREAAILTRAVENVFRKLVRLLIGRMSLTKLQEMIRIIFVEEAEQKLKKERPGKNVPLTKLALLTGLDTRTLSKYLEESKNISPSNREGNFLKGITPESSVLDYWSSSSKYTNRSGDNPLVVKVRRDQPSFETLVADSVTSRGVTAKSLLENLERSKSVKIDSVSQKVTLISRQYMTFENKDDLASIESGLSTVSNLFETIVHNLSVAQNDKELFFQRSNWTHRLSIEKAIEFKRKLRLLLTEAEKSSVELMESFEEDNISENLITAGVGLFYFEEIPSHLGNK
jgi:hypothetical protein